MCSNVELYANFVCELFQSSFAILFEKAESGQDLVYLALLKRLKHKYELSVARYRALLCALSMPTLK